jgi:hypothetical protein
MVIKRLPPALAFLALLAVTATAQIRVVVADFKNTSDQIFLDSWEKSAPDLLRSGLSGIDDIQILEREKLESIFEEQKLALAGFVDDSALVAQVGNLVGAEVIIYGVIHRIDRKFRIDARITRVKNQRVTSEIVEAPDHEHLKEMIELLTRNIRFRLTGKGEYQESISIAGYPTKYFLLATAGFTLATILSIDRYKDNWDKYQDETRLDKFDGYYDKANNARNMARLMAGFGAAALTGTLFCWIKNMATDDITARPQREISITPGVSLRNNQEALYGVQIRF